MAATKKSEFALKAQPEYMALDPAFKPLPKNGHLSEIDPEFATMLPAVEDAMAGLWAFSEWAPFRQAWLAPGPLPEGCPEEGRDVVTEVRRVPVRDGAEVEIKVYRRSGGGGGGGAALVLKTHGGGWAIGSHVTEEAENLMLAGKSGVVVVSVDYRLAPEYPFPTPINDSFDVLKWCKANASSLGVDPERIILAGGSAGGNMAAVLALKARDEGVTGVIGQILSFPVSCHPKFFDSVKDKYELGSYQQNYNAPVVGILKMEFFWDVYEPKPSPDPYHSPLLAKDLSGLPPALVQVAGLDPLRDEGIAYAEALKAAGNDVTLYTYKGLPHVFPSFLVTLPQTKEFYERQAAFVKGLLEKSAKA